MLEILLIRHGYTDGNKKNLFYGRTDYPLNEQGRREAETIGKVLKDVHIDAIYSSPLKRAYDTAQHIGQYHINTPIILCEDLQEMDFGLWEDQHYSHIAQYYKRDWELWCEDWWEVRVPNGESGASMYSRVVKCLNELLTKHSDGRIAIVSHHGCLRSILLHLLKLSKKQYWRFRIDTGTVSRIEWIDDFAVLTLLNGKYI